LLKVLCLYKCSLSFGKKQLRNMKEDKIKEKTKEDESLELPELESDSLPSKIPERSNIIDEKEKLRIFIIKVFLILWILITITSIGGGIVLAFNRNYIIGFVIVSFFGVLNFLIISDLLFDGNGISNISFSILEGKLKVNKKQDENG